MRQPLLPQIRIAMITQHSLLFFLLFTMIVTHFYHSPSTIYQHSFFAFDTLINISIYHKDKQLAQKVSKQIEINMMAQHKSWDPYHPSELTTLNKQLKKNQWIPIPPSLSDLIHDSTTYYHLSNAFNPALGKLIQLWGFHKDESLTLPDAEKITTLINAQINMQQLIIKNNKIKSQQPQISLDFGAIAKGYAIEKAIHLLKNSGVQHAIINAGGDLKAIGSAPQRPWRIGIRHPRKKTMIASLSTKGDESIFTSGDYERFELIKGVRYHHILNPQTGYPANQAISATIIHENASLADAASTALFIAGPDNMQQIAKKFKLTYYMLIDTHLTLYLSKAMFQRLELVEKEKIIIFE